MPDPRAADRSLRARHHLADGVNAPEAQDHFENGLLFLTLPKARAAQGHRIQIGQSAQPTTSPHVSQGMGGRAR